MSTTRGVRRVRKLAMKQLLFAPACDLTALGGHEFAHRAAWRASLARARTHARTHAHTLKCTHARTCVRVHACARTHRRKRTRARTRAHTHWRARARTSCPRCPGCISGFSSFALVGSCGATSRNAIPTPSRNAQANPWLLEFRGFYHAFVGPCEAHSFRDHSIP